MNRDEALEGVIEFLKSLKKYNLRFDTRMENNAKYEIIDNVLYFDIVKGEYLTDYYFRIVLFHKDIRIVNSYLEIVMQKHNNTLYNFINIINLVENVSLSNHDSFKEVKLCPFSII